MAAKQKDEEQIALAKKLKHVPWCEEYEEMISGMLYVPISPPSTPCNLLQHHLLIAPVRLS